MINPPVIPAYGHPPEMAGCSFEAVKTTARFDGIPNGVQSGGVWQETNTGNVWKPLMVRSGPMAEVLVRSGEEYWLKEMLNHPVFPKNWSVTNDDRGYPYLIRPFCYVYSPDTKFKPRYEDAIEIERGVHDLTMKRIEVNDELSVAYDKNLRRWFILDMSIAQRVDKRWQNQNTNFSRMLDFWAHYDENTWLLRRAGATARHYLIYDRGPEPDSPEKWLHRMIWANCYVYVSLNRPLERTWFRPDYKCELIHAEEMQNYFIMNAHSDYMENRTITRAHTWMFTHRPLTEEEEHRHELTLACYGTHFKHE